MSQLVGLMVRLAMLLVLSSVAVAIVVSRWDGQSLSRPRAASGDSLPIVPEATRYAGQAGFHFADSKSHPRFLDLNRGTYVEVHFPDEHILAHASCSPCRDAWGQRRVVACWYGDRAPAGAAPRAEGRIGFAQYTFPEGRPLGTFISEVIPTSTPCWYPGSLTRILFPSTSRQLYGFDFDVARAGRRTSDLESSLQLISWECPRPGSDVNFWEVTWPDDPRLRGKLIASLSWLQTEGPVGWTESQPWWLELDPAGGSIIAVGPLAPSDSAERHRGPERRLSNLLTLPDGRLLLAYLETWGKPPTRSLKVAPAEVDARTGIPRYWPELSVEVASGRMWVQPALSTDGQWIYSPHAHADPQEPPDRFSVERILARLARVVPQPRVSASVLRGAGDLNACNE